MSASRFHDGSAMDLGFQAGYFLPPHLPPPDPPRLHTRQRNRWLRGLKEGLEARDNLLAIQRRKHADAAQRAAKKHRMAAFAKAFDEYESAVA